MTILSFEYYKLGNPHPIFKIVLSDGEAMVVSVGKYYYRISVDVKNFLPKWIKHIVADHYFYQWARTKNERDLNLYLIWSE